MAYLTMFGNILKVAFGLGFVIFLHELGHFLLAKWNGVKVEKFSIGFGRTLLGFRRGETEYVLAAIPLGGFVKMLGENPEEEANQTTDPRAYPNQSVPARMAIISAGVIMNLILGLACFVISYGRGMEYQPARFGAVQAGSPAYEQGIRPGDEVVAIDGRRDVTYSHLTLKVRLSAAGQVIHFDLVRPGQKEPIGLDIEPRREATSPFPTIGVLPIKGLRLSTPPYRASAGVSEPLKEKDGGLLPQDRIVAVGPVGGPLAPVADAFELNRVLVRYRDKPLSVEVTRTRTGANGAQDVASNATVVLPPNRFIDFGFRLTGEPISAIQKGSIADKAGFLIGDRIVAVDGRDDFDPMRLPDYCYDHAGQPVVFKVQRNRTSKAQETLELSATPDDSPTWVEEISSEHEPLELPGLGLAYPVRAKIAAVTPDSPASKAGLKPGDVLNSMLIATSKPGKAEAIVLDDEKPTWLAAFLITLQSVPKQDLNSVTFFRNGSKTPVVVNPRPDPEWYHPLRGLNPEYLIDRLPPQSAGAALRRGSDDTVDNILGIYAMLRSVFQQRVGRKAVGGPIKIFQVAYASAGTGFTELIHFLGILSINLAVLNFLPVPPLDGGQFVYLVAEGVRGRPLPSSAQNVVSWIGIGMLLLLMTFVIFWDVKDLFP